MTGLFFLFCTRQLRPYEESSIGKAFSFNAQVVKQLSQPLSSRFKLNMTIREFKKHLDNNHTGVDLLWHLTPTFRIFHAGETRSALRIALRIARVLASWISASVVKLIRWRTLRTALFWFIMLCRPFSPGLGDAQREGCRQRSLTPSPWRGLCVSRLCSGVLTGSPRPSAQKSRLSIGRRVTSTSH